MKLNNIIYTLLIALLVIITGCEPIEERDTLTNSFDPNDIELKVVQSTPGGNELSIQMNTPGIAGYWDYVIDKKFSDRVEVIYPIPGKSTFTFYVSTAFIEDGTDLSKVKYISKTVDVQIDKLDHELPAAYYALVGKNLEGKTWVFDGTGGDGKLWWYMAAPTNWKEMWWNAAGECCPPPDATGKMTFDLDGGANFTYFASPTADPVKGSSWSFNADYSRLTIKGPGNILGSIDGGGNSGVFEIIELTDEKLVLYVANAAWATGWVWVFKPQ